MVILPLLLSKGSSCLGSKKKEREKKRKREREWRKEKKLGFGREEEQR